MSINLNITQEEFPEIFKLYKKDRLPKIKEIFKTGYNIHFPDISTNNKNLQHQQILKSIEGLRHNDSTDEKLNLLIEEINTLTGINNNSSKKGEVGEKLLENIFNNRYCDVNYEPKNKCPHSGDAWIHLPDNKVVLLESKNYKSRVNKDELEKMEYDMKFNNIKFGLFVSWNSSVQNRKDLDLHCFSYNGENYFVVIISNLGNELNKLDLGFQLIRKLYQHLNNLGEFPWIVNRIQKDLTQLQDIFKQNYKLRESFDFMDKIIRENLDKHHKKLTEYHYEINKIVDNICQEIDSTMKNSIEIKDLDKNELFNFVSKKQFPILRKILDIFEKYKIILTKELKFYKNKIEIGDIKIQKKKIILNLKKISIELENENYQDNIKYIELIIENI
jgi:hypothetical protein